MKIELKPKATMSFDINIEGLYNFCKEKEYIVNGGVEISMYEILCEYLGIEDYVEDDESEEIEDRLRTILSDIDYKENEFNVGTKVKWNDPAINEFYEEDREEQLNRIYEIVEIINKSEGIVLIKDEYGEAEVYIDELERV